MKLRRILLLVLFLAAQQQLSAQQPKLVVGVVVDQMCYDYLWRFYDRFSKDGFRKLMDKGAHFRNVSYNYVPTFTGPGHASVYTGTTPENHGIIANDWFHRPYGRDVNCVSDTSVKTIGSASPDGLKSPHFLKANTVTDQLKLTYPNAKVVAISIKDRSAILPAGHMADGAFWYDHTTGKFISSSFYMDALPKWINDFHSAHPVGNYMDREWTLLRDKAAYTYGNADDTPYEHALGGKTAPVFPYDFRSVPEPERLELFTVMPFANTYLTDLAVAAIEGNALGADAQTDMLTISYSTPDIAGHEFGPYSLEMEDMYLRLDLEIARLLKSLDAQVGKGKYTLFLTADHAVVPVPQYLTDHKLPGGYHYLDQRLPELRDACTARFGTDVIAKVQNNNIYLSESVRGTQREEEVTAFVRSIVLKWPEVKAAYTKAELLGPATGDEWMDKVKLGYDRERSGELVYLLQPGFLPKSTDNEAAHKGTSHGSAFNYDTHVPMLFYGCGVKAQEVFTPYHITDIAATLVHMLNIQRPNAMTGVPMTEVLDKK
jgi:predicted AlkP superfamily pyrophosphatase or phosphodiesterase